MNTNTTLFSLGCRTQHLPLLDDYFGTKSPNREGRTIVRFDLLGCNMVAGCIAGVGATDDNGADDVEGSVTVDCVGGNIPSSGTSVEPGEFGEMQNSSSKTSSGKLERG